MVITLIGYRGCGKSSVAPRLARRLEWNWLDSDAEIERRSGRSITEIFASDGESEFRRLESLVLDDALSQTNLVLASGGGAVLSEHNRNRMRAAGPVVWLHVSVPTLVERLSRSHAAERRPSLTGRPIAEEVADVLAMREPLYRQCATIIVNADSSRPEDTARYIARQVGLAQRPTSRNASEPA